jgi:hypothetical protein
MARLDKSVEYCVNMNSHKPGRPLEYGGPIIEFGRMKITRCHPLSIEKLLEPVSVSAIVVPEIAALNNGRLRHGPRSCLCHA